MDYELNSFRVRDEPSIQRDGSVQNYKVCTFFLGNQGPFTERIKADEFSADKVNEAADRLREQLRRLGV